MEPSPNFSPLKQTPQSESYKPFTELPSYLQIREKVARDIQDKMTPLMKDLVGLTNKAALRARALPESTN